MSNLLIEEYPLIVLPSLATNLGLHEAIILQQIHYWTQSPKAQEREGSKWVYNSYSEWQAQLPFLSTQQIGRAMRSLEKSGLLISGNFNTLAIDRTKWYRIDYDNLASPLFTSKPPLFTSEPPEFASESPLPETTSEITPENIQDIVWPEWFSLLYGVPGFKEDFDHAEAWRVKNKIPLDLAERKAYALRDWWPRQPRSRTKNGSVYSTWQNWCREDRDKGPAAGNFNPRHSRPNIGRTAADYPENFNDPIPVRH